MKTLLATLAAVLVGALVQAPPAAAQTLRVPPVDIHERTLANGLKVYWVLDRAARDVAVQVWYNVGSKDDPVGRSGFAHLFEHLMFKATRDMPAEYITHLTDDVGGENNASTDDDATEFDAVVPPGHLEPLLWAEADRMSSLVVDQASFVAERAVVEAELRQRVLSDPYGRLLEYDIPAASFTTHPYHRSTIGSVADLEAATLADVRAFHARYYRPDNAVLVVVGRFDPQSLDAWVDEYFGPIERPAAAIPRVTVREPPRTGPRSFDSYGSQAPLPAVVLTFAGPRADDPDAAALNVLDALLTAGGASRLNRRLVSDSDVALEAFSDADLRQQGGLIDAGAVLGGGVSISRGKAAIWAVLRGLQEHPVAESELRAAKNQLVAGVLEERQSVDGIATEIGQAAIVEGDPGRVNADLASIQAVTGADVQRVAQTWLRADRSVSIRFHAAGWRRTRGARRLPAEPSPSARAPVGIDTVAEVGPPQRSQPAPPPTAQVQPDLPGPLQRTLPNGLRVIVARMGEAPLASAYLAVRGGSALDPPGEAGLTDLTTSLAVRGAGGRTAMEVEASAEQLGETLDATTDFDSSSLRLSGLAASLPDGLQILFAAATAPNLDPRELRRLRREDDEDLLGSLQDPSAIADFAVAPLVFGRGPYGHAMSGLPRSLGRIDLADVARQQRRLFRPDNAVLVVTGDVDPASVFALADRVFGPWARPPGPPPGLVENRPSPSGRAIAVDMAGAEEASVTVAARSIGRLDPDYFAVEVANAVLGGGYSSRLNDEIRVKRGLTYDAKSEVHALYGAGLFSATVQTRNESAATVAGLMLDQLERLAAAPPSPDELAARKAELVGDFERDAGTSANLAGLLARNAIYGLDAGAVVRYSRSIEAVTADQVAAAARRLADPALTDVLVVGDTRAFLPAMRTRFGDVEVISQDALDFAAPDLRVAIARTPRSR